METKIVNHQDDMETFVGCGNLELYTFATITPLKTNMTLENHHLQSEIHLVDFPLSY